MGAPAEVPNPDLIYDLYTGIYKVQLFRIALLLDVFSPLAQEPADAAHVARACGCHGLCAPGVKDHGEHRRALQAA